MSCFGARSSRLFLATYAESTRFMLVTQFSWGGRLRDEPKEHLRMRLGFFWYPDRKMSVLTFLVSKFFLLQTFLFSYFSFRWFCHFDDDNYVNVPTLVKTLRNFNPHKDVYLGKPSLLKAMEVIRFQTNFTTK